MWSAPDAGGSDHIEKNTKTKSQKTNKKSNFKSEMPIKGLSAISFELWAGKISRNK
jgi:hypothetical protein